jgi:ferric-chelate reductase
MTVVPALDSDHAEALVFHVNIFILAILVLLLILKLPRALALFWSTSEWCNGHILLDRPYRPSAISQSYQNAYPPPSSKEVASEDSHTLFSHSHQPQRIDGKGNPILVSYPPHVASTIRFIRPLMATFRHRISPGFSAGQFMILLYYFGILIYASFYKSDPFTDPLRTGWVATGQLPFVFAFATKNNILGTLLGACYTEVNIFQVVSLPYSQHVCTQLNFIHRFLGRVIVIAANVHGIGYCMFNLLHTYITENCCQSTNGLLMELSCNKSNNQTTLGVLSRSFAWIVCYCVRLHWCGRKHTLSFSQRTSLVQFLCSLR